MKKFRQILEGTLSSNEKTQTVQLESDAAYAASLKKIAMDKQIASLSNRDRNTLTRIADMMKNANDDRKEDISENDMSLDDIKKKWAKEIIAYQDGDINQLPGSAEMDLYGYRDDDAIKTDDADEFEDFVMGLQMAKYKKESVNEGTLNEKDISITMPFDGQPDNSLEGDAQDEFDVTVDDYDEDEGTISVTGSREQIKKWLTSKGDIGFGYDDNQADKVLGDAETGITLDDVKKKYAKEIIAWQTDDRRISKRVIDAIRSIPGFDKNTDAEDYAKGMKMGEYKKESVDETTLAQQQRDKTKSQHDAHAKRMNKSARDSIKKYDQVKKDREKVSGVNEAIDSKDYKLDSERSQFNDGHRGKVVHKEKGTTMYLGSMSWKTPDAAKGHANAYLMGYEIGGEIGARKAQDRYVDQNMDKRMSAKKESFLSYTEGAKEDALRAIKNDRDFKQVKDVDVRATTADMKLAKKNPIQQLRKISDQGRGQMEFLNNKKLKVSKQEADALLRGFDAMKKPQDKEKYQTMISKDSAGLKRILKIVNK